MESSTTQANHSPAFSQASRAGNFVRGMPSLAVARAPATLVWAVCTLDGPFPSKRPGDPDEATFAFHDRRTCLLFGAGHRVQELTLGNTVAHRQPAGGCNRICVTIVLCAAIAPPVKSKRNWLCSLLSETAFARHRAIGSHASCPCVAPGQRQFLGHSGTGPKEHFIGRLPVERWIAFRSRPVIHSWVGFLQAAHCAPPFTASHSHCANHSLVRWATACNWSPNLAR
jgi:hypothetical protein